MVISVEIRDLDDNADDRLVGVLSWDGQKFQIKPPHPALMRSLSQRPVQLEDGTEVMMDAAPEIWLRNLYRALTGAYLRATQPL